MSNPKTAIIAAYASEAAAYAMWAKIQNNDNLVVCGVNIGLGDFRPAEKAVAWVILLESAVYATMVMAPKQVTP